MADRPAVLVTGATGGLGQALVAAFATAGWAVAVHHRDSPAVADALAAEVVRHGGRAGVVRADLAVDDVDGVAEGLLDDAERAAGPLRAPSSSTRRARTSPRGPISTRPAGTRCSEKRCGTPPPCCTPPVGGCPSGGAVVVIGSVEGWRPGPGHAAYAVMKAATHHLVAAAACELGPSGVRVVGVAPGLVERPGLERDWPQGLTRWSSAAPLRRPVRAGEVADVVAFVASPAASALTGAVIPVDAGWSAAW